MYQQGVELQEKFLFTLDWLLAVTRRYSSHVRFCLVRINFGNARVLGDIYGAQEAALKLNEILLCLSLSFRKTDLVTRDGANFWVLTPYTPADGKLADKVKEIIDVVSQNKLLIVERDISIFSLPFEAPELDQNCSAADFLAYLMKNHNRLASQEISIPAEC